VSRRMNVAAGSTAAVVSAIRRGRLAVIMEAFRSGRQAGAEAG